MKLSIVARDAPQEVIVAEFPTAQGMGPVADRGFVDTVWTQTTELLEAADFDPLRHCKKASYNTLLRINIG